MATSPDAAAAAAIQAASDAVNSQKQFIIDSFRGQIYISDQLDVQDTPVYDTLTYTAGQTVSTVNSQLFTNVGSLSGKSFVQSNMQQPQRLPAPQAFSIFGIRLKWDEGILRQDLTAILNGFVFEFWMGEKWYQRGFLEHFSAGMGIDGYTTHATESFYTNGTPHRESMHKLAIPLVIANQMSFYGDLFGPNYVLASAGTGFLLKASLVGLYARGIQ